MRRWTPLKCCLLQLALWALITLSTCAPSNITAVADSAPDTGDSGDAGAGADVDGLQSRDVKPFILRIMPLGASITVGYKSSDGNGYRKWLRQQLRYSGWQVDMVGSLSNGSMHDNNNEGHYGYEINHVAKEAEKTIPQQPNLILINAGTNDGILKYQTASAGKRMDKLITRLFDAIPGTTIILSTLLPNTRQSKRIEQINTQFRKIVATRRANDERIVLAEMSDFIRKDELVDGTHPTDYGYKKMASVWWAAIQEAEADELLQQPKATARGHNKALEKEVDDGGGDPHLPEYDAPDQPGSEAVVVQPALLKIGVQVVLGMFPV
ncbi:SGNH hydrolase [Aspergillus steynii IBT 23096]|uniref:SGNH hydrolase n=1 Tax=Aspergillus steynii IBT 23096 TaxID=1392250 RepID=A0A2I2GMJ6_9EURO|nr:SGNH hydrolase [Aspergillus steynii IBT 23096]PLB54069.1 SGNH hydrolase [Aspergillus steynii IBT 23096]